MSGVTAKHRRHLLVHLDDEREKSLLVDAEVNNLHSLFNKVGSFPEKVEPNLQALLPLSRVLVGTPPQHCCGVLEVVCRHDVRAESIVCNRLDFG